MSRKKDKDNTLAKLTKMYIVLNQGCTAKEISKFLCKGYGLHDNVTTRKIASIIRIYNKQSEWFNIRKENTKYYCDDAYVKGDIE